MRGFLFLVAAATLCAQSFEVTSVKVNRSGNGSAQTPRLFNGKLTATNAMMRWILQAAYGLSSIQINGPTWLDADRFDLAATAPAGVPDTELKPMLQAVLKDRFRLVAHVETKEMPVYNLIVTKEGLKIEPVGPNDPVPPRPTLLPGATTAFSGQYTMEDLTRQFAVPSGRPVIDKTGLKGRYLCFVQYGQLGSDSDQAPDIFGAVQQQLGLRLEPAKAPVEMLIVDHIERSPTEN